MRFLFGIEQSMEGGRGEIVRVEGGLNPVWLPALNSLFLLRKYTKLDHGHVSQIETHFSDRRGQFVASVLVPDLVPSGK